MFFNPFVVEELSGWMKEKKFGSTSDTNAYLTYVIGAAALIMEIINVISGFRAKALLK